MTDDATPREVGSHAGLGLVPERDLVERLRSRRNFMSTDGLRWYMTATPDGDCEDAAAEIERLRAALEVSQAATNAAVSKAQWQARTNAELNALQAEVSRFRAEACRRLNDEFGA